MDIEKIYTIFKDHKLYEGVSVELNTEPDAYYNSWEKFYVTHVSVDVSPAPKLRVRFSCDNEKDSMIIEHRIELNGTELSIERIFDSIYSEAEKKGEEIVNSDTL